ncbi:unnamed protein product, partial [Effrenium voratum]
VLPEGARLPTVVSGTFGGPVLGSHELDGRLDSLEASPARAALKSWKLTWALQADGKLTARSNGPRISAQ